MHKKIILSILTILIVIFLIFLFLQNYKNKNSAPFAVQIPPAFTANASNISDSVSVLSSDGKITLTMKKEVNKNLVTYTFNTNNLVYTKTTNTSDNFSIPFNTWSPDNKYIFLKEIDGEITSFLALNTSGVTFKDGSQFISVSDNFKEKFSDYKLIDITGWASPTLLILKTTKNDGSEGPFFWFDIPSRTFTLLSSRFD